MDSQDATMIHTHIGLVQMCILPQGITNSVAQIMNEMKKVPWNRIPMITMPLLYAIMMKECAIGERMKIPIIEDVGDL